jgi:hypothetical protein
MGERERVEFVCREFYLIVEALSSSSSSDLVFQAHATDPFGRVDQIFGVVPGT